MIAVCMIVDSCIKQQYGAFLTLQYFMNIIFQTNSLIELIIQPKQQKTKPKTHLNNSEIDRF